MTSGCAHVIQGKKVKFSLYLISQALRHEDIWVSGDVAPSFLTSALDGDVWSASRPYRFTSGEKDPGAHWIGGWVGARAGLDAMENRRMLTSLSIHDHLPMSSSSCMLYEAALTLFKAI
jgi:hypothetical protein